MEAQKKKRVGLGARYGWQVASLAAREAVLARAVRTAERAKQLGIEQGQVAAWFGRSTRTLRRWRTNARSEERLAKPRGRRPVKSLRWMRQSLVESMKALGPELAIERYQALHPSMARREVKSMVLRYREVCRRRQRKATHRLLWTKQGTVWATDHSHVPAIQKEYQVAISCRDLASHEQLLWQHCQEDAQATVALLEQNFEEYGAPLVLKADNGPAFRSEELKQLLDAYGVELLPSPPYCPQYNGSCEAANQAMKRRTRVIAEDRGHGGSWSAWDLELARLQVNRLARPWGLNGPTPRQRWLERIPCTEAERRAFRDSCRRLRALVTVEKELSARQLEKEFVARAVQRGAVGRALVQHGLLFVRRRVIRPPFQTIRSDIVS